ncbi:hypothetical protein MBELCI_3765 [Limimaricola cinnabarinus LL-001]|uniref:Uncharacterized protein n=1 Tax=Limimaricola cinnabarinus LL-001 TaxID=1337093 RepID=U3ASK9_9RHOB|nr:hypothetical protein MBELCI_3765 [Limimaricola cinnabarinus LL-001]
MPDRRRAIRAIPLEQPEDLAPGQPQQVRTAMLRKSALSMTLPFPPFFSGQL